MEPHQLIQSALNGGVLSDEATADVLALLEAIGLDGPFASVIARRTATELAEYPPPWRATDLVPALSAAFYNIANELPGILMQQAGEHREMPPLWPRDPAGGIQVKGGAGTITRRTETQEGHGWVYVHFQPAPNAKCKETAWYSFVWPTVTIDSGDGNGPKEVPPKKAHGKDGIQTAAGTKMKFAEWNPDYQTKYIEDEDKKRKQAGKPPLPGINPVDGEPKHTGKPYEPNPVPAPPGEKGFVDSPNWSKRTKDSPSPVESLLKYVFKLRSPRSDEPRILRVTFTVQLKLHFHTYLYCLNPQECLGWFEWDCVETDNITFEYVQENPPAGDWVLQTTLNSSSVVRQADCRLSSVRRARLTFSKMSVALAVQMNGLG